MYRTREIAATFLKDTVLTEGIIERVREDQVRTYFEGVGTITIAGPYNVQGPGTTASREKIFICRPAARADEQACAQKLLSNLAHHAYRRPVNDEDMSQLMGLYQQGAQGNGFEAGVRLALQKILVSPDFIFRGLKAQFDALYERGAEKPVLMPLTVHDFIVGRPSRSKTLDDFIAYAKQFEGVVFATHDQVSAWWRKNYSAP